jgi:hypothetical protein
MTGKKSHHDLWPEGRRHLRCHEFQFAKRPPGQTLAPLTI